MLINYLLMLILSIHLTTTISVNQTSTSSSNHETQGLQSNSSASLALDKAKKGVLSRKIANTSTVNEPKINPSSSVIKIVTEGSGVSRVNLNDTTSVVVSGSKVNSQNILAKSTSTTTTVKPSNNVDPTRVQTNSNVTNENTNKTKDTLVSKNTTSTVAAVKVPTTTKSATTTSTTTTSTTTSTTTTTTPKPKKPTITSAVEDLPELAKVIADNNSKFPSETKSSGSKFSVDYPETPHAQPSQELSGGLYRNHRDYIIPIVSIIFAVPILMGMVIVAYRRFKDFWSTRHYRRMDFLVDGMYND